MVLQGIPKPPRKQKYSCYLVVSTACAQPPSTFGNWSLNDSSSVSFPARILMGDGHRRASGGRQQHEQSMVDVGTGRTHAGDIGTGLRLVGRTLERGLRPRGRERTKRPSHVRRMEPHPTDAGHLG